MFLFQLSIFLFSFIFDSNCIQRFQIYWNVPSKFCSNLYLDHASIIHNTKHVLKGEEADKIVILYEHDFGLWPYINQKNRSEVNGGIPQKGDLSAHLKKCKKDLDLHVPNRLFDGLLIIDMEWWYPYFRLNRYGMTIYRNAAIKHTREQNQALKRGKLIEKAENDWNTVARTWISETLLLIRSLRPMAKIGFYAYPVPDHHLGRDNQIKVHKVIREANDYLQDWFYKSIDHLMPEIYLRDRAENLDDFVHVRETIRESHRVRYSTSPQQSLLLYTKFERTPYNGSNPQFYDENDLCMTVKLARQAGVNGLILWSIHHGTRDLKIGERGGAQCNDLVKYVNDQLVPYLVKEVQEAEECANQRCSGHGHCFTEKVYSLNHCEEIGFEEMKCTCDYGWKGENCSENGP